MKKLLAIAVALMMLSVAACAGATTVGICQLVQHPALDLATQGFKDALSAKIPDVVFDEQNASGDSATCATIVNGFVSAGVDLIMANATPALQAAVAATGDIPILATSITDYATALDMDAATFTGVTGINVSGTTDLAPLDGQADMIVELFPETKKVGLLYCSAEPNSLYQVNTIRGLLEAKGIETKDFAFADSNDVASVTQSAVGDVDVLYIPTDNTAASVTETIAGVVLPGKLPVVAGEEGIVQGCGIGTLTISYYDIGTATGEMAAEILLNGADVSTMPIQAAPQFTKKYNAANAAELGITIPDDYVPCD
ncbi:MAG: ABC transporter substrate-binding protein [Clostridia bacterium]|nr:ABC transporter substrate-binding protein [Oscillospiraceae bacterium]MBR1407771.1 ABC transporter substrate-binding protein [Clostridia bacterium]